MGILLTQEDRMGDFRSAVARREVILVPFDAPAFFSFDAAAVDDVRAHKTTLVAESSGAGVSCHRFDRFPSSAFACKDPALIHPTSVRQACAQAVRDLPGGVVFSPGNRAKHYGESSLVRKAALYNRSTFYRKFVEHACFAPLAAALRRPEPEIRLCALEARALPPCRPPTLQRRPRHPPVRPPHPERPPRTTTPRPPAARCCSPRRSTSRRCCALASSRSGPATSSATR